MLIETRSQKGANAVDENEEALGLAVDAWLMALRRQGLSNRRRAELARLLGRAMRDAGPQTPNEMRVLRRFMEWQREHENKDGTADDH